MIGHDVNVCSLSFQRDSCDCYAVETELRSSRSGHWRWWGALPGIAQLHVVEQVTIPGWDHAEVRLPFSSHMSDFKPATCIYLLMSFTRTRKIWELQSESKFSGGVQKLGVRNYILGDMWVGEQIFIYRGTFPWCFCYLFPLSLWLRSTTLDLIKMAVQTDSTVWVLTS